MADELRMPFVFVPHGRPRPASVPADWVRVPAMMVPRHDDAPSPTSSPRADAPRAARRPSVAPPAPGTSRSAPRPAGEGTGDPVGDLRRLNADLARVQPAVALFPVASPAAPLPAPPPATSAGDDGVPPPVVRAQLLVEGGKVVEGGGRLAERAAPWVGKEAPEVLDRMRTLGHSLARGLSGVLHRDDPHAAGAAPPTGPSDDPSRAPVEDRPAGEAAHDPAAARPGGTASDPAPPDPEDGTPKPGVPKPGRLSTHRKGAVEADPEVPARLNHDEWEAHHLINRANRRRFARLFAAAKRASWQFDGKGNMAPLPGSKEAQGKLAQEKIERALHDNGHGGWNANVRNKLRLIEQKLEEFFKDTAEYDRQAKKALEDLDDELRRELIGLPRVTENEEASPSAAV